LDKKINLPYKQMKEKLLDIQNLNSSLNEKKIIKDLSLSIGEKEIHVIMGPNGSGKSTLSKILAGHPSYTINSGNIFYEGKNLSILSPEERAHKGIFLAFQYPLEISGLTNFDFLKIAYNEKQKALKKTEVNPLEFLEILKPLMEKLKISSEFLYRNLNEGFSGGEKKKNEILQILVLQPKLVILDEIDSGVDIDSLKKICESIKDNLLENSSLLVITHYPQILDYLKPTHLHIFIDGKIQKSGDLSLLQELAKTGYEAFSF